MYGILGRLKAAPIKSQHAREDESCKSALYRQYSQGNPLKDIFK